MSCLYLLQIVPSSSSGCLLGSPSWLPTACCPFSLSSAWPSPPSGLASTTSQTRQVLSKLEFCGHFLSLWQYSSHFPPAKFKHDPVCRSRSIHTITRIALESAETGKRPAKNSSKRMPIRTQLARKNHNNWNQLKSVFPKTGLNNCCFLPIAVRLKSPRKNWRRTTSQVIGRARSSCTTG